MDTVKNTSAVADNAHFHFDVTSMHNTEVTDSGLMLKCTQDGHCLLRPALALGKVHYIRFAILQFGSYPVQSLFFKVTSRSLATLTDVRSWGCPWYPGDEVVFKVDLVNNSICCRCVRWVSSILRVQQELQDDVVFCVSMHAGSPGPMIKLKLLPVLPHHIY